MLAQMPAFRRSWLMSAILLLLSPASMSPGMGPIGAAGLSSHRCPHDRSYLNNTQREALSSRLQQMQLARRGGWSIPVWGGVDNGRYRDINVSVWCSGNQVRPPQCKDDIWGTFGDRLPVWRSPGGHYGHPVRSVHGSVLEFIHNYKVAGTALHDYFACMYGKGSADLDYGLSVMAVRDPIDRFLSGVSEILHRVMLNRCPTGPCSNLAGLKQYQPQSTLWQQVAVKARYNLTDQVLPELLEAFISDVACCHEGPFMDHLQTQSTFATYAERGLNFILHFDDLESGLARLASRLDPFNWAPKKNCPLRLKNQAANRPASIASTARLRRVLDARLVRRLCGIYAQDYACFGLPLPKDCKWPKEITDAWPAAAAASLPPNVTATLHTCNRPSFVAMALKTLATWQEGGFPPDQLEIVLVDDGSEPFTEQHIKRALLSPKQQHSGVSTAVGRYSLHTCTLHAGSDGSDCAGIWEESGGGGEQEKEEGGLMAVRLVRLEFRASIGFKRNVAAAVARGAVVVHYDDDDMHHPQRIAAQAGPILRGEADLTTLSYTNAAGIGADGKVVWFQTRKKSSLPFLGTLAYSSKIAASYPFADSSIAEDLDFANRAALDCARVKVVGIPSVYTRHAFNTWNWTYNSLLKEVAWVPMDQPPSFVTAASASQLAAAAENLGSGKPCLALNRHRPPNFNPKHSVFPQNPIVCCERDPSRRNCVPWVNETAQDPQSRALNLAACTWALYNSTSWEPTTIKMVTCGKRIKFLALQLRKSYEQAVVQVAKEHRKMCGVLSQPSCRLNSSDAAVQAMWNRFKKER